MKTAKQDAPASLNIVYTPLSEVLAWKRNPKKHDPQMMDASIERFGFNDPPTVDEGTGCLVEGHGRIEALKRRKAKGGEPPARVRVQGKEWMVPIVRGVSFASEAEAEAYLLAHNKIGADLWDDDALGRVLSDVQAAGLEGTGWTDESAMRLIAQGMQEEVVPVPAPVVPAREVSTGHPDSMPSRVRIVQLFLDEKTQPRFMEAVNRLSAAYGTHNATETVLRCVEQRAAAVQE